MRIPGGKEALQNDLPNVVLSLVAIGVMRWGSGQEF
jgi:hypothetical protein